MNIAFEISFVMLCALIAVESMALRTMLHETVALKRKYAPAPLPDPTMRIIGSLAPAFQSRTLDSPRIVTDRDLRGQMSMLFFLRLADIAGWDSEASFTLIGAMWNKVDGPLYIVCGEAEAQCRVLRDQLQLNNVDQQSVTIIVDDQSVLSDLFGMTSGPCSVMFDPEGRVIKVGRPSTESVAGT